jgi:hypothetical protein
MALSRQLAEAQAARDGYRRIAAAAVSILTDDQLLVLRDRLVCLQLEEEL